MSSKFDSTRNFPICVMCRDAYGTEPWEITEGWIVQLCTDCVEILELCSEPVPDTIPESWQ